MPDYESVAELIASIEAEQSRLRAALSGNDEAALTKRSTADKWSVAEIVRHLVFAEYAHFGRLISGDKSWRMLGKLAPHNLPVQRMAKMVGTEAASLEAMLETWTAVHDSTRKLLDHDTEETRRALTQHRTHLRTHVKKVESLLKARKP